MLVKCLLTTLLLQGESNGTGNGDTSSLPQTINVDFDPMPSPQKPGTQKSIEGGSKKVKKQATGKGLVLPFDRMTMTFSDLQ